MKLRHHSVAQRRLRGSGFSLIEVMVALIVMSVGLLGIAKMQALALSSTTTSRMRSLMSLEAASFASTMRADRLYWSAETVNPLVVQIGAGAVTSTNDTTLQANKTCPCTSPQIARNDLDEWAKELSDLAPAATSVVTCTPPPATAPSSTPVSCQISVSWTESLVASNAQQALQEQASAPPAPTSFTIYVDP
ncbi:MAG: type pilus assembly protein PilV [Gammaproteobacteria bacterium]|jgi:type IV pilus assembly protein PilV|nr:type pilus assembly protein PilV [Gammaproteobacteria bacterium]